MLQEKSDIEKFNSFFTDYKKKFIYFAFTYLQNESLSEDVVMDSFVYYWENRNLLEENSNIPAYVLTIVKNKCLNHLRANSIRLRVNDQLNQHSLRILQTRISTLEACEPQDLFAREAERLIKEALDSMPSTTRDIFLRSRNQDQTYKEIGDELSISIKTVEYHISKALQILRIYLKDYYPLLLLFYFY